MTNILCTNCYKIVIPIICVDMNNSIRNPVIYYVNYKLANAVSHFETERILKWGKKSVIIKITTQARTVNVWILLYRMSECCGVSSPTPTMIILITYVIDIPVEWGYVRNSF